MLPRHRNLSAGWTRWVLFGGDGEVTAPSWRGRVPFNLFIHQFHTGDLRYELHNHPYAWSVSFILWGGYTEERRCVCDHDEDIDCDQVRTRTLYPGMVNVIWADTFHRIDLRKRTAWTLFLTGRKTQKWCFWNRYTLEYKNASGT